MTLKPSVKVVRDKWKEVLISPVVQTFISIFKALLAFVRWTAVPSDAKSPSTISYHAHRDYKAFSQHVYRKTRDRCRSRRARLGTV
jgi:hypothetical protein